MKAIREALSLLPASQTEAFEKAMREVETTERACLSLYLNGTKGIGNAEAAWLMRIGEGAWTPEASREASSNA